METRNHRLTDTVIQRGNQMNSDFVGKTALLTGAASGIALTTSRMFAQQGARVVMVDIDKEKLEAEVDAIRRKGAEATACPTDIRNYDLVRAAVALAQETYGGVDILVNCAGGSAGRVFGEGCGFDNLSREALEWGIEVNFRAPLYFAHAVLPIMKEQKGGVIINIGSITGMTGGPDAEYSAAKSGMIGFTKSLALLGAPFGVRACCVSPGPILTRPALAQMYTPLGRAGRPDEVAHLILYLCSDKAAFITGDNYMIDGGRSCGAK